MAKLRESFSISCPGKVFLLGEYAVLAGGGALVACVPPRFKLKFLYSDSHLQSSFQEGSPAFELLRQSSDDLVEGISLVFEDPHQGRGGFGRSSAEFVLLEAGLRKLQNPSEPIPSWDNILRRYQNVVSCGSGADVVAQVLGGLVNYRPGKEAKCLDDESARWLSRSLVVFSATQNRPEAKTPTHEHLNQIKQKGFPQAYESELKQLNKWVEAAKTAIASRDAKEVGAIFNQYADALDELGWQSSLTHKIRRELKSEGVLGAVSYTHLTLPTSG